MDFQINVMELIDLQQALRQAQRFNEQAIEFSDRNGLTESIKIYRGNQERVAALYSRLDQLFDKHYPPSSDDAA